MPVHPPIFPLSIEVVKLFISFRRQEHGQLFHPRRRIWARHPWDVDFLLRRPLPSVAVLVPSLFRQIPIQPRVPHATVGRIVRARTGVLGRTLFDASPHERCFRTLPRRYRGRFIGGFVTAVLVRRGRGVFRRRLLFLKRFWQKPGDGLLRRVCWDGYGLG